MTDGKAPEEVPQIMQRTGELMQSYSAPEHHREDWTLFTKVTLEWTMHWLAGADETDCVRYIVYGASHDRPWLLEEQGKASVLDCVVFGETIGETIGRLAGGDYEAERLLAQGLEKELATTHTKVDFAGQLDRAVLTEPATYSAYIRFRTDDSFVRATLHALLCANGIPSTSWDRSYIDKVVEASILFHDLYGFQRHTFERECANIFLIAGLTSSDAHLVDQVYLKALSLQYDTARDATVPPLMKAVCLQYIAGYPSSHMHMSRYGMRQLLTQAVADSVTRTYASIGSTVSYSSHRGHGTTARLKQVSAQASHPAPAGAMLIEGADFLLRPPHTRQQSG
ncbi:hypothetical protein ACFYWY_34900 [Streptomyces sp. NPDC002870]|uniref:hypothetical protein n=1 Tax=Streptomyces sp. NPDC002870 TaxID=3364666 RepID=UPI0036ABA962